MTNSEMTNSPAHFGGKSKIALITSTVALVTLIGGANNKVVRDILHHNDVASAETALHGTGSAKVQQEVNTRNTESAALAALDVATVAAVTGALVLAANCKTSHADKIRKAEAGQGPDPKKFARG